MENFGDIVLCLNSSKKHHHSISSSSIRLEVFRPGLDECIWANYDLCMASGHNGLVGIE